MDIIGTSWRGDQKVSLETFVNDRLQDDQWGNRGGQLEEIEGQLKRQREFLVRLTAQLAEKRVLSVEEVGMMLDTQLTHE